LPALIKAVERNLDGLFLLNWMWRGRPAREKMKS